MVTVGYLGLVGEIQNSPLLIAAILITMVVLVFSLGRQSTRLRRAMGYGRVLEAQTALEEELGDLTQIAQTDVASIEDLLSAHDVDDSQELAEGMKDEAERLSAVLSED